MNRHQPLICVSLAVLMCLVLSTSATAKHLHVSQARPIHFELESECNALDIVLIIDQSGSMGGSPGVPPNDPESFRIDSAHEVIHQLGDNRLYFCPEAVHRVGVISFGDGTEPNDGTEIDLRFTEIKPDPKASLEIWQDDRQRLKDQIVPKNLGSTDFSTAFAAAKRMFDGLSPLGTLPRKRAIILLTDGGPCVYELGCTIKQNTFAPGPYLQQLQDQIEHDFPFQAGEGYYLWIVAMHDRGADYLNQSIGGGIQGTLGDFWRQLAVAHGGSLEELTLNREDIPATFFEILQNVLGTGDVEVLGCGPRYIEPYTETAIFTFFKNQVDLGVSVEHKLGGGTTVTLQNGQSSGAGVTIAEHSVDSHIERYVIYRPDPGVWTVSSGNCEAVRIYRESIAPTITLVKPTAPILLYDLPPFHDPSSPHNLEYEIRERSTGKPFPQDPDYPLDIEVDIISPGGQKYTRALSPSGEAIYRSLEPIPVSELGNYQITLTGKTTSADSRKTEPLSVFPAKRDRYTVYTEIRPFDFEVLQPKPDVVLPLNQPGATGILPIEVVLRLVDGTGKEIEPGLVFAGDPSTWFEATLTDEQQTAMRATMTREEAQPHALTASFEGVANPGKYTLQVVMTGVYREDRFRPVKDRDALSFRRVRTKYIDFEIVEPQTGKEQPLNEVGGGTSRLIPFSVSVKLVDSSDQLLDPGSVFGSEATSVFKATLYGPGGSTVASVDLGQDPVAGPGHFSNQIPGQDVEGEYRLEVELVEDPTQVQYEPLARAHNAVFRRVRTEPFDFRILQPQPGAVLPVHQPGRACVLGHLAVPSLVLQLTDITGERPIDPQNVLTGSPSQALIVRLVGPDGEVEDIELEAVQSARGPQFVGVPSGAFDTGGQHSFEISVRAESLNPRYAPLEPTRKVIFDRRDTLMTNPLACRVGSGLTGLAGILVLFGLVMFARSLPSGELLFQDPRTRLELVDPVIIRWYHRLRHIGGAKLREIGLSKIVVRRADPVSEADRAIYLEIYDEEGEPIIAQQLESGETIPLLRGINLRYE